MEVEVVRQASKVSISLIFSSYAHRSGGPGSIPNGLKQSNCIAMMSAWEIIRKFPLKRKTEKTGPNEP